MDSTFFTVYSAKKVVQIDLKQKMARGYCQLFFFIISEATDISVTSKFLIDCLKKILPFLLKKMPYLLNYCIVTDS